MCKDRDRPHATGVAGLRARRFEIPTPYAAAPPANADSVQATRPAIPRLEPHEGLGRIADALGRDGAAIVESFVPAAILDRLEAEVAFDLLRQPTGGRGDDPVWRIVHGTATRRIGSLARRAPSFLEILLDPRLRALGESWLGRLGGPPVLNTAQLISIGPGERSQPLHRDGASWRPLLGPGPDVMIACMVALSDFQRDNGATRVVPGSQAWSDFDRIPGREDLAVAEMTRGSALFYTGKVLHGGGANRTQDRWRTGLHLSWIPGWLRPEEHHQLAIPLELARRLPEEAQRLLGFSTYHPPVEAAGGRLGLVDGDDVALLLEA